MKFRYNLEQNSKKQHCPKCNKKTFVRYVDSQTGEYLPIEFGRCDRENSCGYFEKPKITMENTFEVKYEPPAPTSYHPHYLVTAGGRNFEENNFIQFLKTKFPDDEVKKAILKYLIGTSKYWEGATVFWQIDNNVKVRHGKVMLYNADTGKRVKNESGKSYINSVRSILKLKDFNLKQCLFGLHLINEKETKNIAIVESEKTAVIMSLFKPEYLWLSTGSKHGFKYELLKPIKNYNIIAFPDKSEFNDWESEAIELNEFGFKINVSDWLEKQNVPNGTDLADMYLESDKKEYQQTKIIQTNSEANVNQMALKNPNIIKLIDTFDLVDENGIPFKIDKGEKTLIS